MHNDPKKFLFMFMRKWDYRGEGGGGWLMGDEDGHFLSCLCFFVSANISEVHIDNNWQKNFSF